MVFVGSLHLHELLRTSGTDRAGGWGLVGLDMAARRAQEESRAVRVSFLRHGCQRHGAEPRPKRFIVNCEGRASRSRATFHGNAPFGFRTHLNGPPALPNSPTRHGLKLCVTSGHYFSRATCIARSDVPSISAKQEEPSIVSARQRLDSSRRSAIVEYRHAAERHLGVMRILCHVPRDGHGRMSVKYDRSAAESKKAGGSKCAFALRGNSSAAVSPDCLSARQKKPQPPGLAAQGVAAFCVLPMMRPYTWTNSSSNAPQMGHEAGGWPNSIWPQVGQR